MIERHDSKQIAEVVLTLYEAPPIRFRVSQWTENC